ncbi:Bacterial OB fold (BOF) protein, partial [Haemophilus influenzae]
NAFGMV